MVPIFLLAAFALEIHDASFRGNLAEVQRQLAAGVSPNTLNRYGYPPLFFAAESGNAPLLRLLLSHKADPNLAAPGGETPLLAAARNGHTEAVQALLAAGAKVDATVSSPASAAGQTALHWASANGHAPVVDALLRAGAERDRRLPSGFTPLLFAARSGRAEVVRVLLAAGADPNEILLPAPNYKPPRGYRLGPLPKPQTSALLFATLSGHFELALALVQAGANPNDLRSGWSVLHAVSEVRKPGLGDNDPAPLGSGKLTSLDFVRALKQHGADFDLRMTKRHKPGGTSLNTLGATPFFIAARAADAELMRLLAELGANPTLPNEDGSTPLMAAAGLGTRSPGEDPGTEAEVLAAIEVALALGNDINAVDRKGETAMHAAAYKNLPKAVLLLAEKGADPKIWNRPNAQGWTPLTIARGYRFGNFKPSEVTVAAFAQLGVR